MFILEKNILLPCFFLSLLVFIGACNAAEHTVTPAIGIQNSINNAHSGDTLNLISGTYKEHDITVNKKIVINGPATGTKPTIDAENNGRVFYVNSDVSVTLKNLVIKNGKISTNGGGINNNGNLQVINCDFTSNNAMHGGGIYNMGTLNVNDATFTNNKVTAPDGYGGAIYNGNIIKNSVFTSNQAINGGAIAGSDELFNCTFNNNMATVNGGAVLDPGKVSYCKFISNSAGRYGGGIYNYTCTLDVTRSNFINNKANRGGAIHNEGNEGGVAHSNITFCTFNNNVALRKNDPGSMITTQYGLGGAINNYYGLRIMPLTMGYVSSYSIQKNIIRYCSFKANVSDYGGAINNDGAQLFANYNQLINNDGKLLGKEVCSDSDSSDSTLNWWGSNASPSNKVFYTKISPWLVETVTTNPEKITDNSLSKIRVDLNHDSSGVYHDPRKGHVPDGILVVFKTSLGSISSSEQLVNGSTQAILKSGTVNGVANVSARVDNQTVNKKVNIGLGITHINPANYTVINNVRQIITINFSELIKTGPKYKNITVKNSKGILVPLKKAIKGNKLYVARSNGNYTNGSYTINLPTNAITDLKGRMLTNYTSKFTVNTKYPFYVFNTDPASNGVTNNISKVITITFSKSIKKGPKYDNISVKNSYGVTAPFNKTISGNKLIIKRAMGSYGEHEYSLVIPANAVTDLAGRPLLSYYKSNFRVVPPKHLNTKTYAILVAISQYQYHPNDNIPRLDYCDDDLNDMYKICTDVWRMPKSHIFTLLNSQAKKANIQALFKKVASILSPSEQLVFYFAGHGSVRIDDYGEGKIDPVPDEEIINGYPIEENFLCYDDGGADTNIEFVVRDDELVSWFKDVPNGLCILDSCFSGGFQEDFARHMSNCTILMGCAKREYTYEIQNLKNGLFTYYLERAFRSGNNPAGNNPNIDLNHNGVVSAEEAFLYAQKNVQNKIKAQNPQIYDPKSQEFEIRETIKPTVIAIDPKQKAVINKTRKDINITFSETMKPGTSIKSITIKNSAGNKVPINIYLKGNILKLTLKKGNYANGTKYTINIPTTAITDLSGNRLAKAYTSYFTIDIKPPQVLSASPNNNNTLYSRSADILVNLSENIYKSTYWTKILVKNLTSKKYVPISKGISQNSIIIKTGYRTKYTWYQVVIPVAAVRDEAGNRLATIYTFKFRTGS